MVTVPGRPASALPELPLVEFGVEHLAFYVAHVEHAFEQFGDFDRSGTYKHGASGIAQADYLLDYGGIFLLLGLVNAVVHILSRHGAVGGDGHTSSL